MYREIRKSYMKIYYLFIFEFIITWIITFPLVIMTGCNWKIRILMMNESNC